MQAWVVLGVLQAAAPAIPIALTLEEATQRALRVSPVVAAAAGAVRAPRGRRAEAWWPFPDNPALEFGRLRRSSGVARTTDWSWIASQDIEIAGQSAVRTRSETSRLRAAESRVDEARRSEALNAARRYLALGIAERRTALQDSTAEFARRLADFARRQFDAGETNRLELNAALVESARANSAAQRSRADARAAAAALAQALALAPDSLPVTRGLPPIPELAWQSEQALLALAISRRPDLRASRSAREGADRALTLARLSVIPNLTVSAQGGREASADRLFGFGLGVRVPLFHRQQGAIGAAAADRIAAHAEETAVVRAITAEVQSSAERFRRARSAEREFSTTALGAAGENIALTERALLEGEVSVTDVLVLRSTTASARLEYLEVLRDAFEAWFELAAALASEPAELPGLLATGRELR